MQMNLHGTLKGHKGWVTQIATTPQFLDMIPSDSQDHHHMETEIISTSSKAEPPQCTFLAWSADGQTLLLTKRKMYFMRGR
uniref:Uncharacterized protein n=2 Tax=Ursus TaxID=9639 RepID=A0A452U8F5_URSMA